jgi:hypothetical protein
LTDRHYALFANNQHPLQLSCYEEYNKFLRSVHDKAAYEQSQEENARMQQIIQERTNLLRHKDGESLSIDDISDIYIQVKGEQREKNNITLSTRTKTGEINDYLELRRPFGAAQ